MSWRRTHLLKSIKQKIQDTIWIEIECSDEGLNLVADRVESAVSRQGGEDRDKLRVAMRVLTKQVELFRAHKRIGVDHDDFAQELVGSKRDHLRGNYLQDVSSSQKQGTHEVAWKALQHELTTQAGHTISLQSLLNELNKAGVVLGAIKSEMEKPTDVKEGAPQHLPVPFCRLLAHLAHYGNSIIEDCLRANCDGVLNARTPGSGLKKIGKEEARILQKLEKCTMNR